MKHNTNLLESERKSKQMLKLDAKCNVHNCHRRNIPGVFLILSAATMSLATRSSPLSTDETYITDLMCLHKKPRLFRSEEREGEVTSPPSPINRVGHVDLRKCQTVVEKGAGTPSCMNHMSICVVYYQLSKIWWCTPVKTPGNNKGEPTNHQRHPSTS